MYLRGAFVTRLSLTGQVVLVRSFLYSPLSEEFLLTLMVLILVRCVSYAARDSFSEDFLF